MKSVKDVENQRGRFYVHTMQVIPDWYCKYMETQKLFDVKSGSNEVIHAFKCEVSVQETLILLMNITFILIISIQLQQENNILELCISKYWSNYGTTQLQYSLEFCGIKRTASSECEFLLLFLNIYFRTYFRGRFGVFVFVLICLYLRIFGKSFGFKCFVCVFNVILAKSILC